MSKVGLLRTRRGAQHVGMPGGQSRCGLHGPQMTAVPAERDGLRRGAVLGQPLRVAAGDGDAVLGDEPTAEA